MKEPTRVLYSFDLHGILQALAAKTHVQVALLEQRFDPEASWGANAGLGVGCDLLLEPIKKQILKLRTQTSRLLQPVLPSSRWWPKGTIYTWTHEQEQWCAVPCVRRTNSQGWPLTRG